jgi:hypothetical protein
MSFLKFFINKLKCKSSCSMNEDYCPTKCKEYFDNINNYDISKKDVLKIFSILNKSKLLL